MLFFRTNTVHLNFNLLVFPSAICGFHITENQNIGAVSMQVRGGGKHKHTNSSGDEVFLEVPPGGLRAH